jgi:hypothetical protein
MRLLVSTVTEPPLGIVCPGRLPRAPDGHAQGVRLPKLDHPPITLHLRPHPLDPIEVVRRGRQLPHLGPRSPHCLAHVRMQVAAHMSEHPKGDPARGWAAAPFPYPSRAGAPQCRRRQSTGSSHPRSLARPSGSATPNARPRRTPAPAVGDTHTQIHRVRFHPWPPGEARVRFDPEHANVNSSSQLLVGTPRAREPARRPRGSPLYTPSQPMVKRVVWPRGRCHDLDATVGLAHRLLVFQGFLAFPRAPWPERVVRLSSQGLLCSDAVDRLAPAQFVGHEGRSSKHHRILQIASGSGSDSQRTRIPSHARSEGEFVDRAGASGRLRHLQQIK